MDFEEYIKTFQQNNQDQSEFVQTVVALLKDLEKYFRTHQKQLEIFECFCEPEVVNQFRVIWTDDEGNSRVNRGFRVQFSQVLGPCKGGLRFSKETNLAKMKFLAFEQMMKNSISNFNIGGGMCGSDFDPNHKSENEKINFTQNFAEQLLKFSSTENEIFVGDHGVGEKEISIIFGKMKQMETRNCSVLNGRGWGIPLSCPQATGYGLVHLLMSALKDKKQEINGKKIVISGCGKVAMATAELCLEVGGTVLTLSDKSGTIFETGGFTNNQLKNVMNIKSKGGKCADYKSASKTVLFFEGKSPWHINCDVAIPCARENEIDLSDASNLVNHDCRFVVEGSNLASSHSAAEFFRTSNLNYFPSKLAGLGGIAMSALESSQNSTRVFWTKPEIEEKLKVIMENVYKSTRDIAKDMGRPNDFAFGANVLGFKRIIESMMSQGYVRVSN